MTLLVLEGAFSREQLIWREEERYNKKVMLEAQPCENILSPGRGAADRGPQKKAACACLPNAPKQNDVGST